MNQMEPQLEFGKWHEVETNEGTEYIPGDAVILPEGYDDIPGWLDECRTLLCDYVQGSQIETVETVEGYGARLSMPGYLDCTDWTVFESEDEAAQHLADEFLTDDYGFDDVEEFATYVDLPESVLRPLLEQIRDDENCFEEDRKRAALMLATDLDTWPTHDTGNQFDSGRATYLVCTDEEANEACRENIDDSLWAFSADFLSGCTRIDSCVFEALADKCESANEAVRSIVDATCGIDEVAEQAIRADGRGHFLSGYDGEELESGEFFVYRVY